jgi:hypothetical protein
VGWRDGPNGGLSRHVSFFFFLILSFYFCFADLNSNWFSNYLAGLSTPLNEV